MRKELLSVFMFQPCPASSLLCKRTADLHSANLETTSPQTSMLQRAQGQNRGSGSLMRFQKSEWNNEKWSRKDLTGLQWDCLVDLYLPNSDLMKSHFLGSGLDADAHFRFICFMSYSEKWIQLKNFCFFVIYGSDIYCENWNLAQLFLCQDTVNLTTELITSALL